MILLVDPTSLAQAERSRSAVVLEAAARRARHTVHAEDARSARERLLPLLREAAEVDIAVWGPALAPVAVAVALAAGITPDRILLRTLGAGSPDPVGDALELGADRGALVTSTRVRTLPLLRIDSGASDGPLFAASVAFGATASLLRATAAPAAAGFDLLRRVAGRWADPGTSEDTDEAPLDAAVSVDGAPPRPAGNVLLAAALPPNRLLRRAIEPSVDGRFTVLSGDADAGRLLAAGALGLTGAAPGLERTTTGHLVVETTADLLVDGATLPARGRTVHMIRPGPTIRFAVA